MILLLDIGNTNTHLGLASARGVSKQASLPTAGWFDGSAPARLIRFVGRAMLEGAAVCSVVPRATPCARQCATKIWRLPWLELTPSTIRSLGFDYPRPDTIGPDRLANAVALRHDYGAPAVAVDFGTAVTFDVVNRAGNFTGGIIAPGLALMTGYLHEKTALLPEIRIRPSRVVIGKNTEQAMLSGAWHGFRGMVRELIQELKRELRCPRLPVVATGGYARLIAPHVPEITAIEPLLTLEGLRLTWMANLKFQVQGSKFKGGGAQPLR